MIDVRIQLADFDPAKQFARLEAQHPRAVASFIALVDPEDGPGVLIDHYPAMAKAELGRIAEEAAGRWPGAAILILHRHGPIKSGGRVAFIGVGAGDSVAALEACAYLTAELRARAPFWRRNLRPEMSDAVQADKD